MCSKLKECISGDCDECSRYTSKKVYSPEQSFPINQAIQLCDCIIECNGFYAVVEHKTGKLNSEKLRDAVNQLNNCESELKKICSNVEVMKILLYKSIDVPHSKHKIKIDMLEDHGIKCFYIWSINKAKKKKKKEICQLLKSLYHNSTEPQTA